MKQVLDGYKFFGCSVSDQTLYINNMMYEVLIVKGPIWLLPDIYDIFDDLSPLYSNIKKYFDLSGETI